MYRALFVAALAATASAFAPASSVLPKASTARAAVSRGPSMQDRFAYKTSCGYGLSLSLPPSLSSMQDRKTWCRYDIQAPYWAENAQELLLWKGCCGALGVRASTKACTALTKR